MSYLSIWLTKIWKYLREKSRFVVIFILAGDLVGIVCCLGAFNREEDVVFGYVHFINTECCILSIRTHGSQMTFV